MPWHIRLFGPIRIKVNGTEVRSPAGKSRSVLAYLLLYPTVAHTRDQIMDALWPDLPYDRARRALSDAIYRLRETPAGQWIQTEGETIALERNSSLQVDAWEFSALAHASQPAEPACIV